MLLEVLWLAKTMAEEITAAECKAEQTLVSAEERAAKLVSEAKEKAKNEQKRILKEVELSSDELLKNAAERAERFKADAREEAKGMLGGLEQSYGANISAAVSRAAEILKG